MSATKELRTELAGLLERLATLSGADRRRSVDIVIRAIQLRCMIARAEGEVIPPGGPGMQCVVQGHPIRVGCPECPAASDALLGPLAQALRTGAEPTRK